MMTFRRPLALTFVLPILGCSKGEDPNKPLTAPKVTIGKIELADKCNKEYRIDKSGDTVTSCAITAEITVGDITCAKDGRPIAAADKTLKSCGVKGVVTAGPLKCNKGLSFYPDGTIKECHLAEPVKSAGQECKSMISFKSDGTFEKCS